MWQPSSKMWAYCRLICTKCTFIVQTSTSQSTKMYLLNVRKKAWFNSCLYQLGSTYCNRKNFTMQQKNSNVPHNRSHFQLKFKYTTPSARRWSCHQLDKKFLELESEQTNKIFRWIFIWKSHLLTCRM
jgi:hypothetical protein